MSHYNWRRNNLITRSQRWNSFFDANRLLIQVQQMLANNQKDLNGIRYESLPSEVWLKGTLAGLMWVFDLCGKSTGLLNSQIKPAFNDTVDKSWFQHACYSKPKIFSISWTNPHRKGLNFHTNKRRAGSYLSSQGVGGAHTDTHIHRAHSG